jgi:hypothetical protein
MPCLREPVTQYCEILPARQPLSSQIASYQDMRRGASELGGTETMGEPLTSKDGPLRNYILPKNLILDVTTRDRIQRQIDLGRHQDPAAVIAYAMMLLDIEEDWLGFPRTPAPEARVLHH